MIKKEYSSLFQSKASQERMVGCSPLLSETAGIFVMQIEQQFYGQNTDQTCMGQKSADWRQR